MVRTTEAPTEDTEPEQTTQSYADDLRRGDVVEYEYRHEDGHRVTGEGVVAKTAKGKIVVILPEARRRGALRVFKTDHYGTRPGLVSTNNREGNGRKRSVGEGGKLRRTGDRVTVDYKQMSGYRVVDE